MCVCVSLAGGRLYWMMLYIVNYHVFIHEPSSTSTPEVVGVVRTRHSHRHCHHHHHHQYRHQHCCIGRSAGRSVGRLARKSYRLLWHVLTNYFVFAVDHKSLALNESKHNLSMVGFPATRPQSISHTHTHTLAPTNASCKHTQWA